MRIGDQLTREQAIAILQAPIPREKPPEPEPEYAPPAVYPPKALRTRWVKMGPSEWELQYLCGGRWRWSYVTARKPRPLRPEEGGRVKAHALRNGGDYYQDWSVLQPNETVE